MNERQPVKAILAEPDPLQKITLWSDHYVGIAERAVPMLLLVRDAAASDPAAATLWEQLVETEGQEAPANDLAWAYLSKAGVLASLGDPAPALELCDRAIHIRRRME